MALVANAASRLRLRAVALRCGSTEIVFEVWERYLPGRVAHDRRPAAGGRVGAVPAAGRVEVAAGAARRDGDDLGTRLTGSGSRSVIRRHGLGPHQPASQA